MTVTRLRSNRFAALGPTVHERRVPSGRTVRYVDEGRPDWPVLVFFGGAGTSVRAVRLVEFARPLREELGVRLVSVERPGLGLSPHDPGCGPGEHAEDVWALLDLLDVEEVSVVAISGGGPYAASLLARRPDRIRSVHLACALSGPPDRRTTFDLDAVLADPVSWWRFPASSPVHRIPGFADSAVEEATHALLAHGAASTGEGLRAAFALYAGFELPDLRAVSAPVDLYWGTEDPLVPLSHLDRWRAALPTVRHVRRYPGEGHDVQYRHWDQLLHDVRFGNGRVLVTLDGHTWAAAPGEAEEVLARGGHLGLADWADTG